MKQKLTYTAISFALAIALARAFQDRLDNVPPYFTWIGAVNIISWTFYGLDKRISELRSLKGWRVPELTLNLLTLTGGILGAWIGRQMFNHKTNLKKHLGMFVILVLATLIHIFLLIRSFYGPPLQWWPPSSWFAF